MSQLLEDVEVDELEFEKIEDVLVVTFLWPNHVLEYDNAFTKIISEAGDLHKIVINIFLPSTKSTSLLAMFARLHKRKKTICICCCDTMREILYKTRMNQILSIANTSEEAMEILRELP